MTRTRRSVLARLAPALLAAPLAAALWAPAAAQVAVNPGALDLLPSTPQHTAPRPATRPAARPAAARPPSRPATPLPGAAPAGPAPAAPTAATKPPLPTVPPAIAALPPPAPVPSARQAPPPVVPLAADAPGIATPIQGGTRVTFGSDRADLNPGTDAAIRAIGRTLHSDDRATVTILAYAAGSPDDPSAGRRLALSRALAARAVLINEGIASTRIYPRSMAAPGGAEGADRLDILVTTPAQAAPVQGAAR